MHEFRGKYRRSKTGVSSLPEYHVWYAMMARCYVTKNPAYHRYGGRKILVCRRWHKLENFIADMGPRPEGMTLDRIDNMRGYNAKNCRWASWSQQNMNKRPYVSKRRGPRI